RHAALTERVLHRIRCRSRSRSSAGAPCSRASYSPRSAAGRLRQGIPTAQSSAAPRLPASQWDGSSEPWLSGRSFSPLSSPAFCHQERVSRQGGSRALLAGDWVRIGEKSEFGIGLGSPPPRLVLVETSPLPPQRSGRSPARRCQSLFYGLSRGLRRSG